MRPLGLRRRKPSEYVHRINAGQVNRQTPLRPRHRRARPRRPHRAIGVARQPILPSAWLRSKLLVVFTLSLKQPEVRSLKSAICATICWIAATGWGLAADSEQTPTREIYRKTAWNMGLEFAKCAGLYWALAEIEDDPGMRQSIYDTGNGASVAALYHFALIMPGTEAAAFAKKETKAQLTYFRADLTVPDSAKVDSQMHICLALGDVQGQIVSEMRARAHGIEP
jgi:hypothetical protein